MFVAYRTEVDKLEAQLLLQQCRVGRNAARDIARRIEGQHGFWDFEARKRTHEAQASTEDIAVVGAELYGEALRQSLAGQVQVLSGEGTPELAA